MFAYLHHVRVQGSIHYILNLEHVERTLTVDFYEMHELKTILTVTNKHRYRA